MYEDNILKDFDIGTRRNLDFSKESITMLK